MVRITLRENLAKLEHEQWVQWSKSIVDTEPISQKRLSRWEKLWVNYDLLSEKQKETDRHWADKVIKQIKFMDEEIKKLKEEISILKDMLHIKENKLRR